MAGLGLGLGGKEVSFGFPWPKNLYPERLRLKSVSVLQREPW